MAGRVGGLGGVLKEPAPHRVGPGPLRRVGLWGPGAPPSVGGGGGRAGAPPIRLPAFTRDGKASWDNIYTPAHRVASAPVVLLPGCLLYTSDAADERSGVDLGGRRIIKQKKILVFELQRQVPSQQRGITN